MAIIVTSLSGRTSEALGLKHIRARQLELSLGDFDFICRPFIPNFRLEIETGTSLAGLEGSSGSNLVSLPVKVCKVR